MFLNNFHIGNGRLMINKPVKISRKDARRLIVHQGGLGVNSPFGSGKKAVLAAIRHLSYVQIDTISVIRRAHHHVLGARVPKYKPAHLFDLVSKDQKVFEYWSHAAAYLPIEDYRYTWRLKDFFREKKDRWPKPDPKLMKDVLATIRTEGSKMARDFVDVRPDGGGWWNLKPAKWALERLFLEGDLVVSERRNFQKVYDLAERCISVDIDHSRPSDEEFAEYLIMRALRVHGIAQIREISYLRKGVKILIESVLSNLIDEGTISTVKVSGLKDRNYFALTSVLNDEKVRVARKFSFLSPFDNTVIQRDRLRDLFEYDYLIECYVPKEKRKHGYFVLPILFGDRFVGRMDAKAERKTGTFLVQSLAFEPGVSMYKLDMDSFAKSLSVFAAFNDCNRIQLNQVQNDFLKSAIEKRV